MVFKLREKDTGGHQRITYIARFLVSEYGIIEVTTLIIQTHWKQLYNSFDASWILCYRCKVYHSSTSRDKHKKKHL